MHNPSIKFLIKYLAIMILALSAMHVTKKLLPQNKQEVFHLDLLNMDKTLVDSLITAMPDSSKAALIFGENLVYIDSVNYNMISDTIFLKNYFNRLFEKLKNEHKLFYAYHPFQNNYTTPKNSRYFRFSIKRYYLISRIAESNGIYSGWSYKKNIRPELINVTDSLQTAYRLQQNFLRSGNYFHLFEDKSLTHTHFDFEGLKIAKPEIVSDTRKEILNFLNSDFQIFILPKEKISEAKNILLKLIRKYPLYRKLLYQKLRKIVKYQYYAKQKHTEPKNNKQLNDKILSFLFGEKSVFIIQKNNDLQLPLQTGNYYPIVNLTDSLAQSFLEIFTNYASFRDVSKQLSNNTYRKKIKRHKHIILINDSTFKKYTKDSLNRLLKLFPKEKNIIINFGDFKNLALLKDSLNIIQMPGDSSFTHQLAPQVLFGGTDISGQIPYTLNTQIIFGTGLKLKANRLGYSAAERVNVSSEKLKKINQIVYEAIEEGAFPGCQIFVAKEGKVIYNKSFGYYTYQKEQRVNKRTLYDLASLTKIAATTIASMKMINDGKIKLNDELGKFFRDTKIDYSNIEADTLIKVDTFYIAEIENINDFIKNKDTINIDSTKFIIKDTIITKLTPLTNIFKVQLIDLLKHKSGIAPSLPIYRYVYYRYIFFKDLIKTHKHYQRQLAHLLRLPYIEIPDTILMQMHLPKEIDSIINTELSSIYYRYFSHLKTDSSNIQICDSMYLRNQYLDTIWQDTKQLPVANKKYTKYSDINMILLQMAIDSLNKTTINNYLQKNIYKPLGLRNISYLPLKNFEKSRIVPTENDKQWRYTLLQGFVHDPSAAILGGIAGNAGLFANAHDLGVLFQMILNGGSYGGKQFINPEIIKQFTTKQENKRGLGFDMYNSYAVIGDLAPENTYGHSGFTGTCIWVDPENELIYIFLSNRVYPSAKNWKIISMHIRERIHDAIYEAIED